MKIFLNLLILSALFTGCTQKEDPPVDLDNMAMGEKTNDREIK
jgi:hypothetical protein